MNAGPYSEYLEQSWSFPSITQARKEQLQRISDIRGRGIITYAAKPKPGNNKLDISIVHRDLMMLTDQMEAVGTRSVDVLLETLGGSGEAVEDIVRALRHKFTRVSFIVPGVAKSAGTIMAMSGNQILMGPYSSLGPIDAQVPFDGRPLSADALKSGFDRILKNSQAALNKAYVPMLSRLSPGDLVYWENALAFGKERVAEWLAQYMFKGWKKHKEESRAVTDDDRRQRGEEIANSLCDHERWRSHGRSIKMEDLRAMGVPVVDYSKNASLADAINRYFILLNLTFDQSNLYKIIETPGTQVFRFAAEESLKQPPPPAAPGPAPAPGSPPMSPGGQIQATSAAFEIQCKPCGTSYVLQADLGAKRALEKGRLRFPPDNRFHCPTCGHVHDLSNIRKEFESQSGLPIVQ